MNTKPSQLAFPWDAPSPRAAQPIQCIASLAKRMLAAFPEIALSCRTLVKWSAEHLALQTRWALASRAIDDPMERAMPLIERALRNDPPAARRRIMAALRETHRRTEGLAEAIDPQAGHRDAA